jgi:hypothetical protein
MTKCELCDAPANRHATSNCGDEFHTCEEHSQYLAGWVRDSDREARCEARESRRYEAQAYGLADDDY